MHYTSIQNIHKVIDPLFMDELNAEFEGICNGSVIEPVASKMFSTSSNTTQQKTFCA
ncbi:MAG: hypothetical protein IJP61_06135 [Treponema sp.]|nr:hypothetical protein [Treponema sp.]